MSFTVTRLPLAAVLPAFANYKERIGEAGFRLPLPPTGRVWKTPSGKAEFLVFPGLNEDPRISDPEVLTLTALRSHDQYNTTIYGFDDRYRGVFGRRDVLFMNAQDIAERGLVAGESVEVLISLAHHHARSGTPAYKSVPVQ